MRNYFGEPMPGDPSVTDALAFRIGDFNTAQIFGEWNVAFGRHIEVGAGLGFYKRARSHGVSRRGRRERLRNLTGVEAARRAADGARPLPAVRRSWRRPAVRRAPASARCSSVTAKSETSSIPATLDIFPGKFVETGTAFGGLLLGGVRIPLGGDIYSMGLEGRYQWGVGDLPDGEFVADKIDLAGGQFNVTFSVRF